jgi:hypothetical protein
MDIPLVINGTALPFSGDVALQIVSEGPTDTKRYCARFPVAGALKNDAKQFKAKNAPAPAACSPSGAFLDTGDTIF